MSWITLGFWLVNKNYPGLWLADSTRPTLLISINSCIIKFGSCLIFEETVDNHRECILYFASLSLYQEWTISPLTKIAISHLRSFEWTSKYYWLKRAQFSTLFSTNFPVCPEHVMRTFMRWKLSWHGVLFKRKIKNTNLENFRWLNPG